VRGSLAEREDISMNGIRVSRGFAEIDGTGRTERLFSAGGKGSNRVTRAISQGRSWERETVAPQMTIEIRWAFGGRA
jgi:hypothetical protein